MPGGNDEFGFGLGEQIEQILLILFRPAVKVIGMPANIGRVAVYQVFFGCQRQRLAEIGAGEMPIIETQCLANLFDLGGNFGDVCLGKTFRFVTKGNVEFATFVETQDAVEG